MSITFGIAGRDSDADINLSNANASALLEWIGIPPAPGGEIPAKELGARVRRRLWPEHRERGDEGLAASVLTEPGRCTLIDYGRDAGYFQRRALQLLRLADVAGDGLIGWG
jgi:hypothetical protein